MTQTQPHPGLTDLFQYSYMAALRGRRTRRIARGVSIQAGELSYQSPNKPAPLTPLEEAVLIVTTGLTGVTMHDGPIQKPQGGKELGTPFINVLGRSAASADNSQATSFFMINDEGIWLIKRLHGREALDRFGELPPRWEDWSESDWLGVADAVKHRVADKRLEFPREFPYYIGWNKQTSNRPGTTIFFPVVDCTSQYINGLLILLSEPDGQRPLFVDDWRRFKPKGVLDWAAWVGSRLRLVQKVPYQPIGGIKRVRGGFVNKDIAIPLGLGHTMRTDYESLFLMQNLMLTTEALGLGSWVHGAPVMPYVFQRDPAKEWLGLGFRMEASKKKWGNNPPPVPAAELNPVGLDGVLEGNCPPYVKSMDEAVDRVIEQKFGGRGAYGDKDVFGKAYARPQYGEAYLREMQPHSKETIQYVKDICNYIWDTYGRFPAHVDAFYTPDVWVQVHHVETEYYEKFYAPPQFERQAAHESVWGER